MWADRVNYVIRKIPYSGVKGCFNQGIVFSDQPLQDNEIFEVRIDETIGLWNGSIEIGR